MIVFKPSDGMSDEQSNVFGHGLCLSESCFS